MRNLILAMIFLLFSSSSVFAETWDFGIGLPFYSGRMENIFPLQLEMGVASVKAMALVLVYNQPRFILFQGLQEN